MNSIPILRILKNMEADYYDFSSSLFYCGIDSSQYRLVWDDNTKKTLCIYKKKSRLCFRLLPQIVASVQNLNLFHCPNRSHRFTPWLLLFILLLLPLIYLSPKKFFTFDFPLILITIPIMLTNTKELNYQHQKNPKLNSLSSS